MLFLTKFTKLDIQALIDALVAWERVKPGQVGKRIVFEKYGIRGGVKDYVFTAVIYKLERKRGLIDKIINASGLDVSRLDDYSKALLRLIVYEKFFGKKESRLYRSLIKHGPLAVERLSRGVVRINNVKAIIERIIKTTYTPSSLIEKLEFKYSAPYDFIKRIIDLIGQEEAEKFFESIEKLYYISFRVNTLKTNIEDVIVKLREEGYIVEKSRLTPFILKLKGPFNYAGSKVFRDGLIIPQDEASALASLLLNPQPREFIVDLCAAPGGKTTHIAELMENKGKIIAVELYEDRARRLRQILEKTGVKIVQVLVIDGKDTPQILGEEIADRVLLDPPCTSTGAVVKSPEAKWRFSSERLKELVEEQRLLMEAAIKLLKPGGYMLYTTCSVLREENEDNVKWLLEKYRKCIELVDIKYPGLSQGFIPGTLRTWPHIHETSGFFYAMFYKKNSCHI